MIRPALAGTTVLVTRPSGQAEGLSERIRAAGGEPVLRPAIRIVPLDARAPVEHGLDAGPVPDWVVFVSANAVRHGLDRVTADVPLAAIGPATAAALAAAGRPAQLVAARAESEGLLEDPALASVAGRLIVIVRGVGGRERLAEGLRARGAEVRYEEVYRRERAPIAAAERRTLVDRWRDGGIDVYTATSVEILNNLHDMLGSEAASLLASTPLVTASARVVKQAERRDHRGARLLASRPDDDALVQAIADWRSGAAHHGEAGDYP